MLKGSLFTSSTSSIFETHKGTPTSLRCGKQAGVTLVTPIKTATTRGKSDISAHYYRLGNIYQYLLYRPLLWLPLQLFALDHFVQDRGRSLAMIYSSLISKHASYCQRLLVLGRGRSPLLIPSECLVSRFLFTRLHPVCLYSELNIYLDGTYRSLCPICHSSPITVEITVMQTVRRRQNLCNIQFMHYKVDNELKLNWWRQLRCRQTFAISGLCIIIYALQSKRLYI